jgi:hypothetical protein
VAQRASVTERVLTGLFMRVKPGWTSLHRQQLLVAGVRARVPRVAVPKVCETGVGIIANDRLLG